MARPGTRWPWWLLVAAALAAGAFLRVWQLGRQVLMDDEWHAIHKLLQADALNIATHFGGADYCIPLTLYFKGLYALGALSEWPMRLPMLLAGLAMLLMPLLLRRLSLPTRAVWTALLALSPVLVYLTRTARPYALTCLLAGFAVLAFWHWWQGGARARRWGAGYAVATVLAGWLHLLTLAFTSLPFLWFGLPALWRARRGGQGRPVWRLLALGLLTLLPLLALLLPPLLGDWQAMRGKAGLGKMDWTAAWRTVLMACGNPHPVLVLGLLVLVGLGAWQLARRHGAWLAYLGFVAAGGIALILISEPNWIQHPGVLMRYALPVLPLLLLLLAEGLAWAALGLLRWPWLAMPACAAVLAGVWASGPMPARLYWPNQFMGHAAFQFDADLAYTRDKVGFAVSHINPFYRRLARQAPGSLVIGEGPWRLESYFNPLPWYQQVDRQWRKIVMTVPLCSRHEWGEYKPERRGIHLRQFVHLQDILAGRNHGIDVLVLHLQPWDDIGRPGVWPDMAACLARVRQRLGPPMYQDAELAAFDLRRPARSQPE